MRKTKQHKHALLVHLGNAIRNQRLNMGITQKELAAAAKLHRTYITDIEAGHRNISLLMYERLTNALLCSLSLPILEAEQALVRLSNE